MRNQDWSGQARGAAAVKGTHIETELRSERTDAGLADDRAARAPQEALNMAWSEFVKGDVMSIYPTMKSGHQRDGGRPMSYVILGDGGKLILASHR
jgi:hypothetical protein